MLCAEGVCGIWRRASEQGARAAAASFALRSGRACARLRHGKRHGLLHGEIHRQGWRFREGRPARRKGAKKGHAVKKGDDAFGKEGPEQGKGQKTVWGKRSGRRARLERAAGSSLAQIAPAGAMQAERGYVCIRKKTPALPAAQTADKPQKQNTFRRRKTEGVSLSAPGNALSLSML